MEGHANDAGPQDDDDCSTRSPPSPIPQTRPASEQRRPGSMVELWGRCCQSEAARERLEAEVKSLWSERSAWAAERRSLMARFQAAGFSNSGNAVLNNGTSGQACNDGAEPQESQSTPSAKRQNLAEHRTAVPSSGSNGSCEPSGRSQAGADAARTLFNVRQVSEEGQVDEVLKVRTPPDGNADSSLAASKRLQDKSGQQIVAANSPCKLLFWQENAIAKASRGQNASTSTASFVAPCSHPTSVLPASPSWLDSGGISPASARSPAKYARHLPPQSRSASAACRTTDRDASYVARLQDDAGCQGADGRNLRCGKAVASRACIGDYKPASASHEDGKTEAASVADADRRLRQGRPLGWQILGAVPSPARVRSHSLGHVEGRVHEEAKPCSLKRNAAAEVAGLGRQRASQGYVACGDPWRAEGSEAWPADGPTVSRPFGGCKTFKWKAELGRVYDLPDFVCSRLQRLRQHSQASSDAAPAKFQKLGAEQNEGWQTLPIRLSR